MKYNESDERKCHVCGKHFVVQSAENYVYKRWFNNRENFFCSWGCLRKWERERGSKADRRDRIIEALKDGLSAEEISNRYDVDKTNVVYWQKKLGMVES